MVKFLNEAFNNKWPDWAKEIVANNWSIKQAVDIANVTVHTDFDKSYLKDPTKICFFKVETEGIAKRTWSGIYHTGIKSYYLVQGGDGYVYHDDRIVNENGREQNLSNKAKKWVIENMVDFCWVDKYETDSDELRRQRASASSQGGDWKRGKGQFPKEIRDWTTDEFGDRICNNHIEWRVPAGQDKSGYSINPDKYTKKLYTIGQDNYAERLEDMYKKTLEVRKLYDDLKIVSPNELKSPQKRSAWRRFSNPIREFRWIVNNIIATYNRMVEEIGEEIDNASDNGEDWSRNPNANYFYKLYRDFKHRYAELIKRMNEETNAELMR